jgi:two-component system sensor histidine kinase KdpD
MTRDWFPIEELVEAALARLSRVGDTARVRVELPTEPPVVLVDAHLMVNLMINLLDNALRYAPHGPIVVAVEVIADKVSMTVRDEGPGLPDGEPDELFDRFFRGKNTRRIRGSGLGLSICRATAHAHGGTLTARPGLDGRGSAFRLLLPLDDDADAGRLNAPLVEEEA